MQTLHTLTWTHTDRVPPRLTDEAALAAFAECIHGVNAGVFLVVSRLTVMMSYNA